MRALLDGYATFRSEYVAGSATFLKQLASAHQSPSAMFVGCSDSRVLPELLTDSEPGELFVVRNIANRVPPFAEADASVGAALEYAADVLHVEHFVVCGHTGCGGVKAALDGLANLPLPSLREWLAPMEEAIRLRDDPGAPPAARWRAAVEVNVVAQLANFATYSALRDNLDRGQLHLHGWVYDLDEAGVHVLDPATGRFVPPTQLAP
jgi:carbonic anhydrase